jgi:hypothetical protein
MNELMNTSLITVLGEQLELANEKIERLQKAVDKAIWILEESKKVQRPDFKLGFTYCLFPQPHLDIILDEIKQLIKGE